MHTTETPYEYTFDTVLDFLTFEQAVENELQSLQMKDQAGIEVQSRQSREVLLIDLLDRLQHRRNALDEGVSGPVTFEFRDGGDLMVSVISLLLAGAQVEQVGVEDGHDAQEVSDRLASLAVDLDELCPMDVIGGTEVTFLALEGEE